MQNRVFLSTGVDYVDKSVDICASTEVVVKNESTYVDKISRSKNGFEERCESDTT